MRLLNLNVVPGRVLIGPMGNGNSSPTPPVYTYSWENDNVDLQFNDGTSGGLNVLTTDNPADPLTYLTYDIGYITNVTSLSLGSNKWRISFSTVADSGTTLPLIKTIVAHTAIFNVNFPGYVVYDFIMFGSLAMSNGSTDGITFSNIIFWYGQYPQIWGSNFYINADAGAGSTGFTTNINGFALVSDYRMDVSGIVPVISSGNGLVSGSLGPVDSISHLSAMLMQVSETIPGGTTVIATWPGITSWPIWHWIFPD